MYVETLTYAFLASSVNKRYPWSRNYLLAQRLTGPHTSADGNKKLSYCWETVRRESMPRIAEMDVEMTT